MRSSLPWLTIHIQAESEPSKELYWWPGMGAQVEETIKLCITSQRSFAHCHSSPYPFQMAHGINLLSTLWDPLTKPFIVLPVTLVDYFSKWLEIAFMPQVNYSAVIQFLSTVFSHEGNLKELISDHSSQFMSCKFEIVFVKPRNYASDVTCVFTHANGEVKCFNRTLSTHC